MPGWQGASIAVVCAWLTQRGEGLETDIQCNLVGGVLLCGPPADTAGGPNNGDFTEIHISASQMHGRLKQLAELSIPGYTIVVDLSANALDMEQLAEAAADGGTGMMLANIYSFCIVLAFCMLLAFLEKKYKIVGKKQLDELATLNGMRKEATHIVLNPDDAVQDVESRMGSKILGSVEPGEPLTNGGKVMNPMLLVSPSSDNNGGAIERGAMTGIHHKVDGLAAKHGGNTVLGEAVGHAVNHVIDKEVGEIKQRTKTNYGQQKSKLQALSPRQKSESSSPLSTVTTKQTSKTAETLPHSTTTEADAIGASSSASSGPSNPLTAVAPATATTRKLDTTEALPITTDREDEVDATSTSSGSSNSSATTPIVTNQKADTTKSLLNRGNQGTYKNSSYKGRAIMDPNVDKKMDDWWASNTKR